VGLQHEVAYSTIIVLKIALLSVITNFVIRKRDKILRNIMKNKDKSTKI